MIERGGGDPELAPLFVRYGRLTNTAPKLLVAIAYHESGFKPTARSRVGAVGLMQVLPEPRAWPELRGRCPGRMTAKALRDPEVNVCYGAHIFREFRRTHRERALYAYNNGTGRRNGYAERVYRSMTKLSHAADTAR